MMFLFSPGFFFFFVVFFFCFFFGGGGGPLGRLVLSLKLEVAVPVSSIKNASRDRTVIYKFNILSLHRIGYLFNQSQ